MMLLGALLLPPVIIFIDLHLARKYYRAMHDIKGWEAINKWFKRRRLILAGLVVIYLALGGVLLYTNLAQLPGLRHESKQYLDSASKYLKKKKYNEAAIELRNAIKKNPEDSEAYLMLARVQTRLGQNMEAMESYKKAISLNASQYESQLERGRLAFYLKNTPSALKDATEAATEAAKLQPEKPEPLLLLAQIYTATGKYDLALEQCRAILGKEFATPESRQQFITLLLRLRAFALALQATEAGLKVAPNDTTLKIMQGTALDGLGRSEEAVKVLQAAATADPASAAPQIALGDQHMRHGEFIAALEAYDEALRRDPNSEKAMNNIASLTAEHGFDFERAAALASRLYAKHPKDPTVADTLGWTLFRQGKTRDAVPLLKQAVTGMPGNPVHRYHLGAALLQEGYQAAGRKELETALRISGNFDGAAKARALLAGKVEKSGH
jgi:cytochrome c-type biogenesis protein CcmH/NrfG